MCKTSPGVFASKFTMRHYPPLIKFLLRFGISPRTVLLVASDLVSMIGTMLSILLIRAAFGGLEPAIYHWVFPILLISPLLGGSLGLYQAIGMPAHQMMKTIFLFVSLVYGAILAALFLSQTGDLYSRMVIMGSWIATLFAMPLLRSLCTRIFSKHTWWCREMIIFDSGTSGHHYWVYLKKHPDLCLLPVKIYRLQIIRTPLSDIIAQAKKDWPNAVALILPGKDGNGNFVAQVSRHFRKVLLVPDFEEGFKRYWLTPCQIGGVTALLLNQNLHDKRKLKFKRGMDIFFCILSLPVLLPLGMLLALLIRLDSTGAPIYRQKRVGRGGTSMWVYKFRTMVDGADGILDKCFKEDPVLKQEWERDHKLKHDPRLTRMGHFLRKTSLDELPQIINVLEGSMSLVGPRPIVAREIEKYGDVFDEYCRVRPGLTGLWQISGRNNTTYAERVAFDHYYINNWSVWMDIWILARTIPVALTGYGAY